MEDCLFCKIVKGEIPCEKIFENDKVLSFRDINPLAQIHYLVIHKEHSRDLSEMSHNPEQISDIFLAIKKITTGHSLDQLGYRVFTNNGAKAGQSVFHTHFHILSDENLATKWTSNVS
ncbi:MAG: HIT domain-containing protein [Bacteriovoracaceae bacterium]|nr:HIT domain-containing protein [Bacteriovoracaceae bacterium]